VRACARARVRACVAAARGQQSAARRARGARAARGGAHVHVDGGEVQVGAAGRDDAPYLVRALLDRRARGAAGDVVLGVPAGGADALPRACVGVRVCVRVCVRVWVHVRMRRHGRVPVLVLVPMPVRAHAHAHGRVHGRVHARAL